MKIATREATVTPLIVLSKIIELTHKSAVKTIRIDTLSLAFSMKPAEMVVLLQDLEAHGNVKCHFPAPTAKRNNNIGTVELLNYASEQ